MCGAEATSRRLNISGRVATACRGSERCFKQDYEACHSARCNTPLSATKGWTPFNLWSRWVDRTGLQSLVSFRCAWYMEWNPLQSNYTLKIHKNLFRMRKLNNFLHELYGAFIFFWESIRNVENSYILAFLLTLSQSVLEFSNICIRCS